MTFLKWVRPFSISLQGHAVFPNGEIPVARLFRPGGRAGGRIQHLPQQGLRVFVPALSLRQAAGAVVDPARLMSCQRGVGGDLDGGYRRAEGRSPAGGEEDQLGPRRRQSGGGYQVVARGLKYAQAPLFRPFSVMEYISHRRAPALLHTAQRFFLQGRNAPRLIAGRGIFIDYLAVADKVILAFLHKGG